MDGTILDSAEYHWLSWRETLAEERIELTRERFIASFGQRNDTIIREHFGPDVSIVEIARIADRKEERYRELMRTGGVEPLPGVRHWLERLARAGWRQAIASSAPLLNIEAIVDALDIRHLFDAVVTAEDVQRGKPDPQVFLVAASKLSVPAARCIVVEDAPAGIEGARRAGMRSVGVLTSHTHLDADVVVHTLDELPEDMFDRLLVASPS
jgi:HAD superfamily hydrolase (TIGR01509 family)